MSERELPPLHTWLIEPLEPAVAKAIDRLRRAPDVRHVAIMPDVHLANDVCIGTVFGTSQLVYPQAVGGDIGCGMLSIAFDANANVLSDPAIAGKVLAGIRDAVPSTRRHRRATIAQPESLKHDPLSHPHLESIRHDEGSLQFATLGGGNHFIELQTDEDDRLWLMIHSGSRAMGQAIRAHHLAKADPVGSGLKALNATTDAGKAYLHDLVWARHYADANRRAMTEKVVNVLEAACGAKPLMNTVISIDHNHAAREMHGNENFWVHRKGAMPASEGMPGVLPGSMGTASFHVEGRGCPESLNSSAHGAGRALSREAARKTISQRDVHRQMEGIWYDYRIGDSLRDEAPVAYKDIRSVVRGENELVKVTRRLRPVLSYK